MLIGSLGAALGTWACANNPSAQPEHYSCSVGPVWIPPYWQLVKRLQGLQSRRALPWGQTDEAAGADLERLLGKRHIQRGEGVRDTKRAQIYDLVLTLNRDEIFLDFLLSDGAGLRTEAAAGAR
jgi:hypothetical protein